jgi:hypothetical protein
VQLLPQPIELNSLPKNEGDGEVMLPHGESADRRSIGPDGDDSAEFALLVVVASGTVAMSTGHTVWPRAAVVAVVGGDSMMVQDSEGHCL